MDLQWKKAVYPCLDICLNNVQNGEETLEMRLPDGMPDIGRVLSAWGQPILRGKEWRSDSISFSGGMMVWVMYLPEDGTQVRCLEGWIPYQMRWDLPENTHDGQIRFRLRPRFVDARSTSARKLMIRSGLGAYAQALIPTQMEVRQADAQPVGVELQRRRYPLRMYKEAGEKVFHLNEELLLPASAPQPDRILYFAVQPEITEKKVVANRVVFRGNGNLHVLYAAEDGQLHCWDFSVPFSQLADLRESYGADAQTDVAVCVTGLELECDDEAHFQLKCSLIAQYLVEDQQVLEVITDAYSPGKNLEIEKELVSIPVVLDSRSENLHGEQILPGAANIAVDVSLLPDFPRSSGSGDSVTLTLPQSVQLLYYDENGQLQSASSRWDTKYVMKADSACQVCAVPADTEVQAMPGMEKTQISWANCMQLTTCGLAKIPVVTELKPGEPRQADPDRPSLIICRADSSDLWEIAKVSDSSVEAIRRANGLREDPIPGQMLLIPVLE